MTEEKTRTTTFEKIESEWKRDAETGKWGPPPGDPLHKCEFIRVGFQAWGLEAPDKSWRLNLSRLDFASRQPSALLEVYAPNHAAAFPDLNWFVLSHSIGTNGGTNFSQAADRLSRLLGGHKNDWDRRLTYLILRARMANAGTGNGTFSSVSRPKMDTPTPFVFKRRVREGRTISVFGPGSAGKTTIVDALLVSACSGYEIIPGWMPTRRFSSMILDWDEGQEEEKVRMGAICAAYGVELTAGWHYKRMSRPLYDVADELGTYIVDNKIEIVVVSPVGRAARDHGDNLTAPIDEMYEILRTFGTTNILVDHVTGANMKQGAEREFGSTRKRDNARGSYSLYAQSEAIGSRVVVMRNTKADALTPRVAPQAVRIEYDPPEPEDGIYEAIRFAEDVVIEGQTPSSGVGTVVSSDRESQWMRLVRVLREFGPQDTVALCAKTGFHSMRVKDIAREARAKGEIVEFENGAWRLYDADQDGVQF